MEYDRYGEADEGDASRKAQSYKMPPRLLLQDMAATHWVKGLYTYVMVSAQIQVGVMVEVMLMIRAQVQVEVVVRA